MPTYDYVCQACDHAVEIFHSISEAPRRKCPACGKQKLQRRIGKGAGILFKGSGFYQTDYRSASYEAAAKSEQSSGTPASTPETKASPEPTPAPKPDTKSPKKAS